VAAEAEGGVSVAPVSLPPAMIRLVRQSGVEQDCVVASLSTLLGLTYNETLIHCAKANPDCLNIGMTWKEARKAAKRAGAKMRVLRRGGYDVTEATGLLCVQRKRNGHTEQHAVLLWAGRICDGNGELWLDPEDYFEQYGYRHTSLLVRIED
jgi:hypothetical protein